MSRYLAAIAAPLVAFVTYGVQAQEHPPSTLSPPEDTSFYLGRTVLHPEALSGLWEVSDGHGGAIGIHLQLDTSVPADATSLNGIPQSWQDLQVGVYDRRGPAIQRGESNYFGDSERGGSVRFANGRLTLHFVPSFAGALCIDLDLVQQPGDRWAGRLHRGFFDAQVILERPSVQWAFRRSPVVGAWSESTRPGYACIHIVEVAPGEFAGWSDSLLTWGSVQVTPRPTTAAQHYGELMKVRPESGGRFSFELYAYSGACCSHTFLGLPEADGERMEGFWPPGLKQVPHATSWTKMDGDSCVGAWRYGGESTRPQSGAASSGWWSPAGR